MTIYSGPRLAEQLTFGPPRAMSLKTEYSGMGCTIEIVRGVEEAVKHIETYGSGHTDVIVTQNGNTLFISYRHSASRLHAHTPLPANMSNENTICRRESKPCIGL